jgi:MoaA/NifB/PqqE/SkfB family radical SAM enzyme
VIQGIKHIRKNHSHIEIQISCLIVKQNKDNLKKIIQLIRELNVYDFYFSIPCIKDASADFDFYYLPIKELPPHIRDVYNYAQRKNLPIKFMEVPYCVFGFINNSINNNSLPPDHAYCQPQKELQTEKKDLPSYRVKKKLPICENCQVSNKCDGFFKNDIEIFGTGDLQPL